MIQRTAGLMVGLVVLEVSFVSVDEILARFGIVGESGAVPPGPDEFHGLVLR